MVTKLRLKYSPAQNEICFGDVVKYNVITKGRRLGITRGMAQAFVEWGCENVPYMLWGDTINGNIDRYYERYFLPSLKQLKKTDYKWNAQKRELKLFDSRIDFRSADKPENWEGFGYNKIFLNEAGIILYDEYLYNNAVLPMMLDYEDSVLFAAGVPKGKLGKDGKHKFFELFELAKENKSGKYRLMQFSSYDNPFIPKSEIDLLASIYDDKTRRQEIYGEFIDTTNMPFAYAFDATKHVDSCKYIPGHEVMISFDFNVDPITAVAAQHIEGRINVFKEFRLRNSDIYNLCDHIIAALPQALFLVTGDATGQNRSALAAGNINYYTVIRQKLNLSQGQMKQPSINPAVSDRRVLMNSMLQNYPMTIDAEGCPFLIDDYKYVEVNDKGDIDKTKDKHRGHLLDAKGYLLNTFFGYFVRIV